MGKIVFIDFDGTLADRGVVPPPHAEVIREARSRGHRILLCTGRPRSLVSDEVRVLFDGMVGAAGAYLEVDGEVLLDRRFPAELGDRVRALLDAHDAAYILETPDAVHARPTTPARIASLMHVGQDDGSPTSTTGGDIVDALRVSDDLSTVSFSKVANFDANAPMSEVANQLQPEVGFVPSSMATLGDRAGELYLAEVNKSVGMMMAVEHFGADHADIVAIGDGYNDLEMLTDAATAVVIEGSPEPLLALADLVVPPPEQAGLVEAFARLGLTE
ncbi:MAG: HAD family hydrolase [Micropruina sp.]|uniref:HAD hydrolase family protein n=1 Tax=Micropruina sp. TaxID=2737536 RepID=UPI0039E41001